MIDEQTKTKAYAILHFAIHGLDEGLVSLEEFSAIIDELCEELETKHAPSPEPTPHQAKRKAPQASRQPVEWPIIALPLAREASTPTPSVPQALPSTTPPPPAEPPPPEPHHLLARSSYRPLTVTKE